MKKLIALLLFSGWMTAGAQVADSFSDGDFTNEPAWSGDTELFEVNSSEQLHLTATAADTAFLSTANFTAAETEWRFWLKMSFNTSANNHARVYLVSDMQNLEGPLNGYFLQAGGSDDSVAFFRQQGEQLTRLCSCKRLFTGHSTNTFRFRITRDLAGNWEILADSTGGENYFSAGACADNLILSSGYLGVWYRFTSSNGSKFYFDDLYAGPIVYDSIAPVANRLEICGEDTLRLFYSEPVDPVTACDTMNYRLSVRGGHPQSVTMEGGSLVLAFASSFPEAYCDSLAISGVSDLAGNIGRDTAIRFCHFYAGPGDIVINEILADPFESGSRFVELYNRTGMPVDLRELAFTYYSDDSSSSKTVLLTSYPVFIEPTCYSVSCDDSTDVAARYSSADTSCFLETPSFPAIASAGGTILLVRSSDQIVIYKVVYSETMHHPLLSSTEGISLERISPDASSLDPSNWHSAAASAGYATPGIRNSQWWVEEENEEGDVILDPQVFSPDNDGRDDLLHIICRPSGTDFMATVMIYDSRGRAVKHIAGNERIASEGTFAWDGITEERTKAPVGIYIVYVELVSMDGTVKRYKKTAAVAVKF